MPHVAGQDQHRFHEAERQGATDHDRKRADELAELTLNEPQWEERHDAGEDGGDDRPEDLLCPLDRGDQGRFIAVIPGLDVLRDNDRIVHQQTENDDHSEHREEIERDADDLHDDQRAAERNDQPEPHPRRHAPVEKEQQGCEHQKRAPAGVTDQQVEPALDKAGEIRMSLHVAAGGYEIR